MKKKLTPYKAPSVDKLAQLWSWCLDNPRKSALGAFAVLALVASICAKPDIKTSKTVDEARTSSKVVSEDANQTILITNEQWQEYHNLRIEVQTLRKQEQTWKRTTRKRLADGSEEETTDEGSSKNEEAIHTLTTKLDQMAETLAMTEDSLRSSQATVYQQSATIVSKEEIIAVAKGSKWLVGVEVQPDFGSYASAGIRGPIGDVDLAGKIIVPVFGSPTANMVQNLKVGFELGF